MKNLLLCFLAMGILGTVVGCCDSNKCSTTSTNSSASMQTDSKNMQPAH